MALPMTPIFTQTVGSGGAASVTFNNIPQFYTDLKVVISMRTALGSGNIYDIINVAINGGTTKISYTGLYGTGSSAASERVATSSAVNWLGYPEANGATANTFSSHEIYIANFAGSNSKSIMHDYVVENNATANIMGIIGGLWQSSSGISSLSFSSANSANIMQYSTFSLYGILRAGA